MSIVPREPFDWLFEPSEESEETQEASEEEKALSEYELEPQRLIEDQNDQNDIIAIFEENITPPKIIVVEETVVASSEIPSGYQFYVQGRPIFKSEKVSPLIRKGHLLIEVTEFIEKKDFWIDTTGYFSEKIGHAYMWPFNYTIRKECMKFFANVSIDKAGHIYALREIMQGEELLIDYNRSYVGAIKTNPRFDLKNFPVLCAFELGPQFFKEMSPTFYPDERAFSSMKKRVKRLRKKYKKEYENMKRLDETQQDVYKEIFDSIWEKKEKKRKLPTSEEQRLIISKSSFEEPILFRPKSFGEEEEEEEKPAKQLTAYSIKTTEELIRKIEDVSLEKEEMPKTASLQKTRKSRKKPVVQIFEDEYAKLLRADKDASEILPAKLKLIGFFDPEAEENKMPRSVEIKSSGEFGEGVFATENLDNSMIYQIAGDIIYTRQLKNYLARKKDRGAYILQIDLSSIPGAGDGKLWLDLIEHWSGKINHKWDWPYSYPVPTTGEKFFSNVDVSPRAFLGPIRDIEKGEELFFDYGVSYWKNSEKFPIWNIEGIPLLCVLLLGDKFDFLVKHSIVDESVLADIKRRRECVENYKNIDQQIVDIENLDGIHEDLLNRIENLESGIASSKFLIERTKNEERKKEYLKDIKSKKKKVSLLKGQQSEIISSINGLVQEVVSILNASGC